MCLEHCKIIQTEEDIVCYKLFRETAIGTLQSPLQAYDWVVGKETIDTKSLNWYYETIFGECYYTDRLKPYDENDSLNIDRGVFHSFKYLDDAIRYAQTIYLNSYMKRFVIYQCVIPAKSELIVEGMFRISNAYLTESYGSSRIMVTHPVEYVYPDYVRETVF